MKSLDVKSIKYIDFNKKDIKENTKYEFCDHVIITKYKRTFAKGYIPNWSEEVFVDFKS